MGIRILLVIFIICIDLHAQENIISIVNNYMLNKSNYKEILYVSIEEQNLYHIKSDTIFKTCLLYTSPSPRDGLLSRMPSSA